MSSLSIVVVMADTMVNSITEMEATGDVGNMAMAMEVVGSVAEEATLLEV